MLAPICEPMCCCWVSVLLGLTGYFFGWLLVQLNADWPRGPGGTLESSEPHHLEPGR
ncbi:MAG TPA: hypothetical protein P5102_16075 [Candidatus Competibacteraceae bacterium]|nr:hypothetical protein [Candidatus Competibacteraceae bacterium]HRZ07628.1 hypothetical protein [Candidatus Competibacteraceae bacterium]